MKLLIAEFLAFLPVLFSLSCDNQPRCDNGNACCQSEDYTQWCCLTQTDICCDEKYKCCPEGFPCVSSGQTCTKVEHQEKNQSTKTGFKGQKTYELLQLARDRSNSCPDGVLNCPNNYTCCLTSTGYQCCPFANAGCCSDMPHCSPESTSCKSKKTRAFKQDIEMFSTKQAKTGVTGFRNMASIATVESSFQVIACSSKFYCPDGSTCCPVPNSKWMCCPMLNATCCRENFCCPEGMECVVDKKACIFKDFTMAWIRKRPAKKMTFFRDIICPGRTQRCPDLNTCCLVNNSTYGCCPYADAVCCSDFKHCCPSNSQCDVAKRRCVAPLNVMT